jgi:hypothetical protein
MRIHAFSTELPASPLKSAGQRLRHHLACCRDTLTSGSASAIGRIAGTFVSAKTPIPAETTRGVNVDDRAVSRRLMIS